MMRKILLPATKKVSEKYQQFNNYRNENASRIVANWGGTGAMIGGGIGITAGVAVTGYNNNFFKLNSVGKVAVSGGKGFAIGSVFMTGVSCLALYPEALTLFGISMLLKFGSVKKEENNNTKTLTHRR